MKLTKPSLKNKKIVIPSLAIVLVGLSVVGYFIFSSRAATPVPESKVYETDTVIVKYKDNVELATEAKSSEIKKSSKSYKSVEGEVNKKAKRQFWQSGVKKIEKSTPPSFVEQFKNKTGIEIPRGLQQYTEVTLEPGQDSREVAKELKKLPEVVYAYAKPKYVEAAITVDGVSEPNNDLTSAQGYRTLATDGVDATNPVLANYPGVKGDNVKVISVERCYQLNHPDFGGRIPPITPSAIDDGLYFNYPNTTNIFEDCKAYKKVGFDFNFDHGTNVLGILSAQDNGFGITGIVPNAALGVTTTLWCNDTTNSGIPGCDGRELKGRIDLAILRAMEETKPGDVITFSISYTSLDPNGKSWDVPLEYYPQIYEQLKFATDNGRHVVESAGNGLCEDCLDENAIVPIEGNNLDLPHWNLDHGETLKREDSGVILVGAGASPPNSCDSNHGLLTARARLPYSNYGARVNVQGWGECVATTANDSSYTRYFGGTSSASPMVAGVVAAISSVDKALNGRAMLTPQAMRDLIVRTGTPQTGNTAEKIGPLPNIPRALADLKVNGPGTLFGVETGGIVPEAVKPVSKSVCVDEAEHLMFVVTNGGEKNIKVYELNNDNSLKDNKPDYYLGNNKGTTDASITDLIGAYNLTANWSDQQFIDSSLMFSAPASITCDQKHKKVFVGMESFQPYNKSTKKFGNKIAAHIRVYSSNKSEIAKSDNRSTLKKSQFVPYTNTAGGKDAGVDISINALSYDEERDYLYAGAYLEGLLVGKYDNSKSSLTNWVQIAANPKGLIASVKYDKSKKVVYTGMGNDRGAMIYAYDMIEVGRNKAPFLNFYAPGGTKLWFINGLEYDETRQVLFVGSSPDNGQAYIEGIDVRNIRAGIIVEKVSNYKFFPEYYSNEYGKAWFMGMYFDKTNRRLFATNQYEGTYILKMK